MMIKLKLKRRISGNKIRKAERNKVFHPVKEIKFLGRDGEEIVHEVKVYTKNQRTDYSRNRIEKRHVENPTIYKGEDHLYCSPRNIRTPRKCRKTAWKRFRRAFPDIKIDEKRGYKIYEPKPKVPEYPLKPTPKIKF